MFIWLLVSENLALLSSFYLSCDDDGPPGGRALEDGVSIEEAQELPFEATLLLPSDDLMTKFSLGID